MMTFRQCAETVDALARAGRSLRQSNHALSQAKRDNDHKREQLAAFRQMIRLLK